MQIRINISVGNLIFVLEAPARPTFTGGAVRAGPMFENRRECDIFIPAVVYIPRTFASLRRVFKLSWTPASGQKEK